MYHLDDDADDPKPPTGPHVQAQQHYYEMRRRHDVAKRTSSEAYRTMKEAEEKLVEVMMDLGLQRLEYMDDGTKVFFKGRMNLSVTKENEAEVREWLRQNYGDDEIFVVERLDKAEISVRVKEDIDAGQLSELDVPKCMKLKQFPGIQVNGWKDL